MDSWFGKQLEKRIRSDQDQFSDSLSGLGEVIGGRRTRQLNEEAKRRITRDAISELMTYFRLGEADWPEQKMDTEEMLDYFLTPAGIMHRSVELMDDWYCHAVGVYLSTDQNGQLIVLLPRYNHYEYLDHETGEIVRVKHHNAANISPHAICFYRPLPLRPISMKDLLLFMGRELTPYDYGTIAAITLAMIWLSMFTPTVTRYLFSQVLFAETMQPLYSIAVMLVSVSISYTLMSMARQIVLNRILIKTDVSIRAAVMMRLLSLPSSFFRNFSTAELANRAQTINVLCNSLCGAAFSTGITALFSLIYLVQIFDLAPELLSPALLVVALMILLIIATVRLQMRVTEKELKYASIQNGTLYSYITNMEKIKAAGMERRAFVTWLNHYKKSADQVYNPPLILKLKPAFLLGISLLSTLLFFRTALKAHITPSRFMAFQSSFALLITAFTQLFEVVQKIALIRPILHTVKPILDAEPELAENKANVGTLTGAITMNNVSFHYNRSTELVLNHLNLSIRPGEFVAIVGRSGSGKSTLMRLLLGFDRPQSGTISYDKYELSSVNLQSLRRHIGCVMQDDRLFPGSILSNIGISATNFTEEEAWNAAEAAGIADDIRNMPMGMQTLISEGASCISGGQRQRLIIARAIASKPRILLMDEATSALDNLTQMAVSNSLSSMNVTRLIIAHRLSTVRNCDRILVLDHGRIAEQGTYDELMKKQGLFAELIQYQQA